MSDTPFYLTRYLWMPYNCINAIGRGNNIVVRSRLEAMTSGPNFPSSAYPCFTDTTAYPDGTSDYGVRTDRRGVRTVSWIASFSDREEYVTLTYHPTNLTIHVLLASNITWRNGRSLSLQSWDCGWTRETSLTDYAADDCRRDISMSGASDLPGTLTNRVTHYDILGRTVATFTPGAAGARLVTSNSYDGATFRVIQSETTGRPAITYLYDAMGESAGTVRSGISTASETRYEMVSNEVWQVTVHSSSSDGVTNAVATTSRQLTGLSDALRNRIVTVSADGAVTTVKNSFNPATKTKTTTSWTDGAAPAIQSTKFGALVETRSLAERTVRYHEAFLTPYHVRTFHPVTGALRSRRFLNMDEATWDPVYTETWHGTLKVTGETQFDAWGRETVRIDAMGNAVTNFYDGIGRCVATSGATYPVTHGYDAAGRMTALFTTRDGSVWDMTRWVYDRASGLITNKVYAVDTAVSFSYDVTSRSMHATWARGAWREHAYNTDGLFSATTYSDATPAVTLSYDTFQRLAAASNGVATYTFANDLLGAATNETAAIGLTTHEIHREYDSRHRLSALMRGDAVVRYSYDAEDRLAAVSNTAFAVAYTFSADGWNSGHSIALTNGVVLSRTITRDVDRRQLVAGVSNAAVGAVVSDYRCNYDILNRVTTRCGDTFGYNNRSEVTSAAIALNAWQYAYDEMGNSRFATLNASTNFYTVNDLNQYTNIILQPAAHSLQPSYDLDGNLLANGIWALTWDAENRLAAVSSNSAIAVSNAYDHAHRRVLKVTPEATYTYLYDGWNLVRETVVRPDTAVEHIEYVWGIDLSGSLQDAGGVGGLLAVQMGCAWYFPFYDNNGNITSYADETGAIVAEYAYDAFGDTITQSGAMADLFRFRFSTKHFDAETGLYYYGNRFYSPSLRRWLNRDPTGEADGPSLYAFVRNDSINGIDLLGLDRIEVGRCGEVTWVVESTETMGGGCTRCTPVRSRRIDIGTLPLKPAFFGLTTRAAGNAQLNQKYGGGSIPLRQMKKAAKHVHEWFGDISGFIIPAQDARIKALIANPTKPASFTSQDEAGTWACWFAYKNQLETGWEWAGFIHQNAAGQFAIGAPRTEELASASFPGGIGFFETAVGWYHTHPSGEAFSTPDHSLTRWFKRMTKDRPIKMSRGYVGVPSGKVLAESGSSFSGTYVVSP